MAYPARLLALCAALAAACAAPTAETSRCDEVAARLEACTGDVPEGFVEACLSDTSADTRAAIDAIAACEPASDPELGSKADGRAIAKYPFLIACTPAVTAAVVINRARNPEHEGLPSDVRERLRPFFGALVDEARVTFGARMINQWRIFGRDYEFFMSIAAQTLGRNIFVADEYDGSTHMQTLLAHEMVHFQQTRERGGLWGFAWNYCRAFYRAGFDYYGNEMEQEAFAIEDEVRACLAGAPCEIGLVTLGRPEHADCVPGTELDDGGEPGRDVIHISRPRVEDTATLVPIHTALLETTRMRVTVEPGGGVLAPSLWCYSAAEGVVEIAPGAFRDELGDAQAVAVTTWQPGESSAEGQGDVPIEDDVLTVSHAELPDGTHPGYVSVTLAIEHADVSELVIEVEDPNGDRFLLHDRGSTSADGLQTTFVLDGWFSWPSGRWRLLIADHVPGNQGTLRSWSVHVTETEPASAPQE